jgi:Sigma-54 interaction domain
MVISPHRRASARPCDAIPPDDCATNEKIAGTHAQLGMRATPQTHQTRPSPLLLENKGGKFKLANGGTIFLDEIGHMPLELQATLLRVIQRASRRASSSTRISAFLHLLLTKRSQLLNYVEALIFYC